MVIWLVIAPLVMNRFHLVSPVAVLLGPLLAAPVGIAMAAGFGILALGWLAPPLADALGWVCDGCLQFLQYAVEGARSWPGSYFWVAGPGPWWLIGLYALLGGWLFAPRWRPGLRWSGALLAGWVAVGFSAALLRPRDTSELTCTFLSVGHGAAVVVELPGGQTLLYDAGRLGSPTRAARAVSGFLWSRGITHLDAVVISHADADHYNAVPALLRQFTVGVVYVSPVMFWERSGALAALEVAIADAGVPLRATWGGDRLRTQGEAQVEVLHPPQRGVLGSDNANSIVLSIESHGRRVLLTGDLESPGLDDLLAEEPLDCDVVLAPHHGSVFSDPPQFAAWSSPTWAIVSGGPQDRLDLMAGAYEARGARVLHTALRGAVQVKIAARDLSVETWRPAAP
jgi:competence protein ComEC